MFWQNVRNREASLKVKRECWNEGKVATDHLMVVMLIEIECIFLRIEFVRSFLEVHLSHK